MKNIMFSLVTFICVIAIFVYATGELSVRATAEGATTLGNAIQRASVQCYAIEGRYPASIDYLVEHYGLQIDNNKYVVFYDGFASNIMPDITVSLR